MRYLILLFWILVPIAEANGPELEWYKKMKLRGYAQFRYNRLLETNDELVCTTCDTSLGNNQGFSLRRARLVLTEDITDKVSIFIQADFATDGSATSTTGTTTQKNYVSAQDAYFDYALDEYKVWRVRAGLSKVPFDFENLQSSANRAPLDRTDMSTSATPGVRDTGVFIMQASPTMRKRFKELLENNLKGSGDYGNLAFGVYNGQGANVPEKNNDLHSVIRYTYPYQFLNGQFLEGSLQAYEGQYYTSDLENHYDARVGLSIILYPQPFGFQAEYNNGQGPEYDPQVNKIKSLPLHGGYAQLTYQIYHKDNRFYPYFRYETYDGGNKQQNGAPINDMEEWEIGTEWQPNKAFEMTVAYAFSDRFTQSSPTNRSHERGQLLRLQAQINY